MTFQYFFFNTFLGYFLEALPFAIASGIIYYLIKYRKDHTTPPIKKIIDVAFICYIVGLFCLVFALDLMGIIWYRLLYNADSLRPIRWLSGDYQLTLDFFNNIDAHVLGNIVIFLPYGALFPFIGKGHSFKTTVLTGALLVVFIEVIQPLVGRSFDMNDVVLNIAGVVFGTLLSFYTKQSQKKKE